MGSPVATGAQQQGLTQRADNKAQSDEFQETQKQDTMETQESQTAKAAASRQKELEIQ
jgi:hypothetical protein